MRLVLWWCSQRTPACDPKRTHALSAFKSGEAGNDTLLGEKCSDYLNGDDGNDQIVGGESNDTLVGGAGADSFALYPG